MSDNSVGLVDRRRRLPRPYRILIALPLVVGITLAAVGALDEDWEIQLRALGIPPLQRAWLLVREIRLGVLAAVIAALGGILSEVGAVSAVGGNLEGETRAVLSRRIRHHRGRHVLEPFPDEDAFGLVRQGLVQVAQATRAKHNRRYVESRFAEGGEARQKCHIAVGTS